MTPKERQLLKSKLKHMIERCSNKRNSNYKWYGEKGIKVYNEWKENVESFIKWAENNGYKEGLTIERYNTDKDYCPSNCCFVPMSEQSKNSSRNVFIEYKGEHLIISEVARRENVSPEAIRKRIKHGWYRVVDNPNRLRSNPTPFPERE